MKWKYLRIEIDYFNSQMSLRNRFEYIVQNVEKQVKTYIKKQIFTNFYVNITPFTTLLEKITKNEYEIKIVNSIQIEIQPKTFVKHTLMLRNYIEKYGFSHLENKIRRNF